MEHRLTDHVREGEVTMTITAEISITRTWHQDTGQPYPAQVVVADELDNRLLDASTDDLPREVAREYESLLDDYTTA